ncbi:MAG: cytochrome P450 [Pseudomonadota bacterium]
MTAPPIHPLRFPRDPQPRLPIRRRIKALARNWVPLVPTELFSQPMVTRSYGFRSVHFVADPDLVKTILRDTETYERPKGLKEIFEPLTDDSVLFANQEHREQLNALTANAFGMKHVRDACPRMEAETDAMTCALAEGAGRQQRLSGELSQVVQRAMTEFLFSDAHALNPTVVDEAIATFAEVTSARDILRFSSLLPKRWRINQRPPIQRFKSVVDGLIDARRAEPREGDALARLLSLGDLFDDQQIRGAVLTSYYAGRKTTALAIAWSLYLLAVDQDAQRRVREEALEGRTDFARHVVDEALRLYPPLGIMPRRAARKTKLGTTQIGRGDAVLIPVYVVHRHADLWERPDDFWPERFALKGSKPAYRYIAFGGGERYCPGAAFATQLATIAVARLVREFEFSLPDGWTPKLIFMLTIRIQGGVKLDMRRHVP